MKRKLISFAMVMLISVSLCIPAAATNYANTVEENNALVLTLTDTTTGEVQEIKATLETTSALTRSAEETVTAGYSAFIPIQLPSTRTSEPGGKDDGSGVTVLLYVIYTISSNREQIKVSRIYGSWTPSSNLFTVSNREVGMHAGLDSPGILRENPSSNSFDYSTGWGYCNFVPAGDASPFAWADATIRVSGMSGSHLLTAALAFPESR